MDYLIFFLVSLSLIKVKKSKKKAEAKSKLVIGLSLMKLTQFVRFIAHAKLSSISWKRS